MSYFYSGIIKERTCIFILKSVNNNISFVKPLDRHINGDFMKIEEIFELFNNVGSLTFATINNGYPETRIVDLLTYDDDGLYFFTMKTKPLYKQLIESKKLSICGMSANSKVLWKNNMPYNAPGYFIRASGDVREFTLEDALAKNDKRFDYLIDDNKRYPQITAFCMHRFSGEIYDYDFEKEHRGHKLERERFSFNGFALVPAGLTIDSSKCIACGKCEKACSFDAISKKGNTYVIDGKYCDECGNCYTNCPMSAVIHKGEAL